MAAVVEIRIDMADDDDDGDRDPREKFCITPNRDVYILDEERISDSSFDLGSDQEKQKCLLGGEDERVLEEVSLQSKEHKKKKKLQGKKSNNELLSQKPKEKKTIYAVHKCPKCKVGKLKRMTGGTLFHLFGIPLSLVGIIYLILSWIVETAVMLPIVGLVLLYFGLVFEFSAMGCRQKRCSECKQSFPMMFATFDENCEFCEDGVLATESTPLMCIFFGFLTLPMCCFGLFCFNTKKKCYDCSAKHQPGMPKII